MKVTLQLLRSQLEKREYTDRKTGQTATRNVCTFSCVSTQGENIVVTNFGLSEEEYHKLPKTGRLECDIFRYESLNAYCGTIFARNLEVFPK